MIVTFRSSTAAIPITTWENVIYGGGRFFAQSRTDSFEGFRFANSPTGDFWNGIIPPINFWNDLAYGAGKCALIGIRNGTTYDGAYTEDFGATWDTFQIRPFFLTWEKIEYAAGTWVAMTRGTAATSTDDLVSWSDAQLPESADWESIAYGNGLWVCVSSDATNGKVMTSSNGLNWTQASTPDETQSWRSVTYGNGRFVAVASNFADSSSSTMWSDDGINWNIVPPVVNSLWFSVAYGKGQFVAVSISDIAMSSSDFGLTWDLADTPTGTFRWTSVAYGEDTFVAVADNAGASGQGNRSMLATSTGTEPTPPPRPPGEILSPKEQIEDLFARYNDGTDYIRVVRDSTDYVVTMVGAYQYRGRFKIRRLNSNGYLRLGGPLSGTNGQWLPVSEVRDYESLYTYPFPNNGLDDTPAPPYEPNLSRIVANYNTTSGYGQFSVEYALEDLKNVDLPEQPSVADAFAPGTNMYNLDAIGAPEAWASGLTGDGIVVAVLDTGVDVTHIELDDNLWINVGEIPGNNIDDDGNGYIDDVNGWDFVNNDNTLEDLDGHGTHVAGTVSAENNGIGIVGAAFDAKIMPVKILPGTDEGGSYFNLALGIYYAVDNGAHVINMSLGGGYIPPQIIRDAIKYANDNGVICVMAAGNDFDDNPTEASSPQAPGNYASEYGIVVGATNESVEMTTFSNRAGQPIDWDNNGKKELLYVTASGRTIWSTLPNDTLGTKNGTSMAAPLVAAACAILLQADPTLTPNQIRVLLANNTL